MATQEARAVIVTDDRITNANLLDLTDGGATTLHSHAGGGGEVYTDRGDPSAADYTQTTLTADGTYHDLDLSAIVPAGATRVRLYGQITDDVAGRYIVFRKNGHSNSYNLLACQANVANLSEYFQGEVECDTNRVIEYQITNTTITSIGLTVIGWWSPA